VCWQDPGRAQLIHPGTSKPVHKYTNAAKLYQDPGSTDEADRLFLRASKNQSPVQVIILCYHLAIHE